MADYNINKSDGTAHVVPTGTIDNTFDIPLLGQDAINYGDDLAKGQLRQLENFANDSAPSFGASRTVGQLWYDTTAGQGLKIWDGGTWDLLPLDTDVVHQSGAESIAGVKTFSDAAAFTSTAGSPFTVNSTTLVSNLNAHALDGKAWTFFASAVQGQTADDAEPALPLNSAGDGYVLSANLSNDYTWISPAVGTGNVDPADLGGAPGSNFVLLATSATGDQQPQTDAGITYTASTTTLAVSNFVGALNGTATNATLAVTATSATTALNIAVADTTSTSTNVVLVDTAVSASEPTLTDGALTYNATSGTLAATAFSGSGATLTSLSAANISTGTLAVLRGGTGVTVASGSGSQFILQTSPTFVDDITVPLLKNSADIGIEFNGTTMLVTQSNATTGKTTGAQVRHTDTNLYDVGMNVLPQFGWNTNDDLEASHCGMVTGHDNGSPHTLTLEGSGTEDFPIGGITTIINGSATDYTIVDGTATLFFIEPGVGGTDTVGGCTIGAGGVATLYRFADDTFYIWGSEITV